jgi:transposase
MRKAQNDASATRSGEDFIRDSADGTLFVALELGWSDWKLAMATQRGAKPRRRTISARDLLALGRELDQAKAKFNLLADAPVQTCYEAGRDGFWLHRYLSSQGIENVVVDSASIEVNRRARRVKNDKMDAGKLLSILMRYHSGDRKIWSVVRVPSVDDEDIRQRQRDLATLRNERTHHVNRIKGLLAPQGLEVKVDSGLGTRLESLRCWDGQPLPDQLCRAVRREIDRLSLVDQQIEEIKQERRDHQRRKDDERARQVRQLAESAQPAVARRWRWCCSS